MWGIWQSSHESNLVLDVPYFRLKPSRISGSPDAVLIMVIATKSIKYFLDNLIFFPPNAYYIFCEIYLYDS